MELGACDYCSEVVDQFKGQKITKGEQLFIYHYECLKLKISLAENIIDGGKGFMIVQVYKNSGIGGA